MTSVDHSPIDHADRHAGEHQVQHRIIAEEGPSEVEPQIRPDHLEVSRQRWLVEAEHMADLLHGLWVQSAAAAIAAATALAATLLHHLGPAARHAAGRLRRVAQVGQHLLHRAARCQLHHGEVDRDDAEQGRDHQEQPPQDVRSHQRPRAASVCAASAGSTHQAAKSSPVRTGPGGWPKRFQYATHTWPRCHCGTMYQVPQQHPVQRMRGRKQLVMRASRNHTGDHRIHRRVAHASHVLRAGQVGALAAPIVDLLVAERLALAHRRLRHVEIQIVHALLELRRVHRADMGCNPEPAQPLHVG